MGGDWYNCKMNLRHLLILGGIMTAIAILGGIVFSSSEVKTVAPETKIGGKDVKTPEGKFTEIPLVQTKNVKETDPNVRVSVNAEYPVVSLASHPAIAVQANEVIEKYLRDIITTFKGTVGESDEATGSEEPPSDLTIRYTPLLLSPTIISMRFAVSEYLSGSAHPTNKSMILNYDMKARTLLGLPDLLSSSTLALPLLSEFSKKELGAMFQKQGDTLGPELETGTLPTEENFHALGITKSGILIVFDPYQVAPYARGSFEITLRPYEAEGLIPERIIEAMKESTDNIVEATRVP